MAYSSSLSDQKGKLIEATFAAKEADLVRHCGANVRFKGGIFYQLKNGCNWCDLQQRPAALQGRCFGTTNSGEKLES